MLPLHAPEGQYLEENHTTTQEVSTTWLLPLVLVFVAAIQGCPVRVFGLVGLKQS